MKNNKSCGPDSILNEMIKVGFKRLSTYISKLFNVIINTEVVSNNWARGYIVPLHKGGTESVTSNYRVISITSWLGKLFSAVLCINAYAMKLKQITWFQNLKLDLSKANVHSIKYLCCNLSMRNTSQRNDQYMLVCWPKRDIRHHMERWPILQIII